MGLKMREEVEEYAEDDIERRERAKRSVQQYIKEIRVIGGRERG